MADADHALSGSHFEIQPTIAAVQPHRMYDQSRVFTGRMYF
jgi:hypothetical protein